MGAAAFLLLSAPGSSLAVAVLASGVPAVTLIAVGRATPWETSA
jgi:hypothetical protein